MQVTEFAEKRRISNQFCTGVYGFASTEQFLHWARFTLQHGPFPNNEIYMSSIFVNMLAHGEPVAAHYVPIQGMGTNALLQEFSQLLSSGQAHTQGLDDPFWAYFFQRRNATEGMRYDDQLLLSSFVNQIRELLETRHDDTGLAWLDQLETECF